MINTNSVVTNYTPENELLITHSCGEVKVSSF
jgi:hypothetical protein